jgi:hypothetical protein
VNRSEAPDPRSDLYSLGAMIFEMLSGRPPYEAETPLATILKHLNERIPALPASVSPPVGELVQRLMAKETSKRPESGEGFLGELSRALPDGLFLGSLDFKRSTPPRARATRPAVSSSVPRSTEEMLESAATTSQHHTEPEALLVDSLAPTADSDVVPTRPRSRRKLYASLIITVVVCALALGALLLTQPPQPRPSQERTTASLANSDPAVDPNAPQDSPSRAEEDAVLNMDYSALLAPPTDTSAGHASNVALARVTVVTQPPNASVHVNNRYLGISPLPIDLRPGDSVDLLLRLDGYVDFHTSLEVTADLDGTSLGPYTMAPTPARITMTSNPTGAQVIVVATGEEWGQTQLSREVPRSDEPIDLELRLPGYRRELRTLVPNQSDITLHVDLSRNRRSSDDQRDTEGEGEEEGPGPGVFGDPVD